jgi:hypothetical protein
MLIFVREEIQKTPKAMKIIVKKASDIMKFLLILLFIIMESPYYLIEGNPLSNEERKDQNNGCKRVSLCIQSCRDENQTLSYYGSIFRPYSSNRKYDITSLLECEKQCLIYECKDKSYENNK